MWIFMIGLFFCNSLCCLHYWPIGGLEVRPIDGYLPIWSCLGWCLLAYLLPLPT